MCLVAADRPAAVLSGRSDAVTLKQETNQTHRGELLYVVPFGVPNQVMDSIPITSIIKQPKSVK